MKKFLAIFTGSQSGPKADAWNALDPEQRQAQQKAGMEGWFQFMEVNQAAFVDHGGPLGKTKQVSEQGVSDIRNHMSAYTIIEAESHEAAAKIFENHPHFTIFPGDAVEIMECMPIPQM